MAAIRVMAESMPPGAPAEARNASILPAARSLARGVVPCGVVGIAMSGPVGTGPDTCYLVGGFDLVGGVHCVIVVNAAGGLVPMMVPAALMDLTVIGVCVHGVP